MDASARGEPSVWEGRPAWGHYFFLWFFVSILGFRGMISLWMGSLGAAAFNLAGIGMLAASAFFLRRITRYRVTRHAVFRSKGIFGETERSFPISTIASAVERQSRLDRFLGCGDVVLHLKDGTHERLAGVKNPEVVCRKIAALL
jgi:membrane protein YdbS with pleckstrin-like domain